MKKPLEARAAVLNASSQNAFFVVASSAPELDRKQQLSSHKCKCGTVFASVKGLQPFCINCGSDEVEVVDETPEDFGNDEEISCVQCPNPACGTHVIASDAVVASLGGEMKCIACGEPILYITEADASDMHDFDADADADEDEDEDEEETETEEGKKSCADVDPEENDITEELEESDVDDDTDVDEDDSEVTEDTDVDEEVPDFIETSMLNVVGNGEFSMMVGNNLIIATVNEVPVAKLSKEQAGENVAVFNSRSFAEAINHTVSQVGVEKALSHYGFTSIVAKFPFAETIAKHVELALAEETKKVEATLSDLKADFKQCLSIASTGLGKNFFKGKAHALKAGLYEELSAAGVRNPSKIIDKVFAAYSDDYHSTLLALAEELMAKNVDVRNQLAETLLDTNMQPIDDDDEDEVTDFEAKLEGASLVVEEKAISEVASIRSIRQQCAGKKLF